MDSAVQHCGGPKGTVNGRLLDAQKQIRMHPHSHASRSMVLRGSFSYENGSHPLSAVESIAPKAKLSRQNRFCQVKCWRF